MVRHINSEITKLTQRISSLKQKIVEIDNDKIFTDLTPKIEKLVIKKISEKSAEGKTTFDEESKKLLIGEVKKRTYKRTDF